MYTNSDEDLASPCAGYLGVQATVGYIKFSFYWGKISERYQMAY